MTQYVIACHVDGTDEVRYVRHDNDCGYVLEARNLHGATLFDTLEAADMVYSSILAAKPSVYEGGMRGPSSEIWRGLGLNYERMEASGVLSIRPVDIGLPVVKADIDGRIERPTGYVY